MFSGGKKKKSKARELVEFALIVIAISLGVRGAVIQAFKIPSGSMEDTLLIGDKLMVSKFAYGLQVPVPAIIRVFDVPVPFFENRLWNIWGTVERGDVIVFRFPGDRDIDFIKRVMALPGEKIELRKGAVYVNGKALGEHYGINKGGPFGDHVEKNITFGPYTVPEGEVFVMGDNRDRSLDSRFWGGVPINDIKGKAIFIYWSWDSEDGSLRLGRVGKIIR